MTLIIAIMNQLFSKFRELSIRDLKARRDEIFQNSRRIINAHDLTISKYEKQQEILEQGEDQIEMENSEQDLLQETLEDLSTYTHTRNKKKNT